VTVQEVPADVAPRRRLDDLLRVLLGDVAPEDLLEDRPHALQHGAGSRAQVDALRLARLVAHEAGTSSAGRFANSGQINETTTMAPNAIAKAVTTASRP